MVKADQITSSKQHTASLVSIQCNWQLNATVYDSDDHKHQSRRAVRDLLGSNMSCSIVCNSSNPVMHMTLEQRSLLRVMSLGRVPQSQRNSSPGQLHSTGLQSNLSCNCCSMVP